MSGMEFRERKSQVDTISKEKDGMVTVPRLYSKLGGVSQIRAMIAIRR
jgi:hypothetical protein